VVPIGSTSRKDIGHNLEGTRLTITCSRDQADAYEFSIRTPVTPTRWEDFDKELAAGFEAICAAAIADGALLPTLDAHHCCLLLLLLHLLHALVGVAFSGLRSHQHGRSSTGCVTVSHQVRLVLNNAHVCCSSQEHVMMCVQTSPQPQTPYCGMCTIGTTSCHSHVAQQQWGTPPYSPSSGQWECLFLSAFLRTTSLTGKPSFARYACSCSDSDVFHTICAQVMQVCLYHTLCQNALAGTKQKASLPQFYTSVMQCDAMHACTGMLVIVLQNLWLVSSSRIKRMEQEKKRAYE
jgi:hypothetical protein